MWLDLKKKNRNRIAIMKGTENHKNDPLHFFSRRPNFQLNLSEFIN